MFWNSHKHKGIQAFRKIRLRSPLHAILRTCQFNATARILRNYQNTSDIQGYFSPVFNHTTNTFNHVKSHSGGEIERKVKQEIRFKSFKSRVQERVVQEARTVHAKILKLYRYTIKWVMMFS